MSRKGKILIRGDLNPYGRTQMWMGGSQAQRASIGSEWLKTHIGCPRPEVQCWEDKVPELVEKPIRLTAELYETWTPVLECTHIYLFLKEYGGSRLKLPGTLAGFLQPYGNMPQPQLSPCSNLACSMEQLHSKERVTAAK